MYYCCRGISQLSYSEFVHPDISQIAAADAGIPMTDIPVAVSVVCYTSITPFNTANSCHFPRCGSEIVRSWTQQGRKKCKVCPFDSGKLCVTGTVAGSGTACVAITPHNDRICLLQTEVGFMYEFGCLLICLVALPTSRLPGLSH